MFAKVQRAIYFSNEAGLNENVAPGRVSLFVTKNVTTDSAISGNWYPYHLMEDVHDKKVSHRSERVQP